MERGKVGTVRAGTAAYNKGPCRARGAGGAGPSCKLYLPSARAERRADCRFSPPSVSHPSPERSEGLDYEHDFIGDSHSLLSLNSCPSSGPPFADATAQAAVLPLVRRARSARPPA